MPSRRHTATAQGRDDEHLKLDTALLLYRNESGVGRAYATLHDVVKRRGRAQLGPGRPATREGLAGFVQALAGESAFAGWVDPQMLYIGARATAWYEPPRLQRVYFETAHDDAAKNIGSRSAMVQHPGLVFILATTGWYVFMCDHGDRPAAHDALYRAPYFNVWASGRICEGNVARPQRATSANLPAFRGAFFGSRFTHPNVQRASDLTLYKGGLYALWRDLLDARIAEIPLRSCVRHGKHTLRTFIEEIERGKDRDDTDTPF